MNKPVIFENEALELNQEAPITKNDEVIASVQPAEKRTEEPKPQATKPMQKVVKQTVTTKTQPQKIQQTVKTVKKETPKTVTKKEISPKTNKSETTEKKPQTQTQTQTKQEPQKVTETQPQTTETEEQKKQREEREEIIAWNKWRSDLQNQVMKDTRISAPLGTVFRFSCTVDKFGNITNIKTWSDNSTYTPLATRVVKPVLASYQNKTILKFPSNSKRVITNVTGAFKISTVSKYSTPDQYSDYERIKR